jgi:hypothetical protein
MTALGPALDTLIRESGRTSRWLYVAGTSIIVGVCFLLLVLLLFMSKDVKFAPLIPIASLVPVASVPSGLLFHYLVQPARSIPPVDRRDALIIGTWIAAWTLFFVVSIDIGARPRSDPDYARHEVVRLFLTIGVPAFMLCGIAAGFARLWNLRLGTVKQV